MSLYFIALKNYCFKNEGAKNMSNGDFKKKLYNSTKWQKIRKQVLQRDFYICQICGQVNSNIVHHIKELTKDNIADSSIATNKENLITVCNQCHDEIHNRNYRRAKRDYHFDSDGNFVYEKDNSSDSSKKYKKEYTEEQRKKIEHYRKMLK